EHGLDACIAQETARGLGVDASPALDLGCAVRPDEIAETSVDDDGRPIGVGVDGDAIGAQRNECVGPSCLFEGWVALTRHQRERTSQVGQVLEGVTGGDPSPGLPLGDAVTHGKPVRHVARSRAAPELAAIDLGDVAQELTLDPRSTPMRSIDRIDQLFVAVSVLRGHPDLVRSRGRRLKRYRTYVRVSTPFSEDIWLAPRLRKPIDRDPSSGTPMLLTITSTQRPATDLGFLLHKNPANVRTVAMSFGDAHVFYPVATDERCTAALMLEVDPIALVRRGRGGEAFALAQYVNDRPYAASSFMSVAIAKLFGTAMSGRSDDRPELAAGPLPLEVR